MIDGKLYLYVPEDEVRLNELSNTTKHTLIAAIREKRTEQIRGYLPSDLRNATDYVALQYTNQKMGISTLGDFEDSYHLNEEAVYELVSEVEDLHYAEELDEFFRDIKEKSLTTPPNSRSSKRRFYKKT